MMTNLRHSPFLKRATTLQALALVLISLLSPSALFAQAGSPWENAANLLQTSFTGPLARALSLIAIVIGGLRRNRLYPG